MASGHGRQASGDQRRAGDFRARSALGATVRRGSATPEGPELLRGLEATKRRLQGKQVDELERLYERGKGGMGGGVGAGGFF